MSTGQVVTINCSLTRFLFATAATGGILTILHSVDRVKWRPVCCSLRASLLGAPRSVSKPPIGLATEGSFFNLGLHRTLVLQGRIHVTLTGKGAHHCPQLATGLVSGVMLTPRC
ncbi:unnamed protein product [Pleuronectes platessa]|uniref:Uncharacterized protein n=1 Tax=Pleuronectes platessa TaxID=8262 RepID=A0A9N7V1D5_PLEPL|nr:unnamed protein product [Pleuronectes platessa]